MSNETATKKSVEGQTNLAYVDEWVSVNDTAWVLRGKAAGQVHGTIAHFAKVARGAFDVHVLHADKTKRITGNRKDAMRVAEEFCRTLISKTVEQIKEEDDRVELEVEAHGINFARKQVVKWLVETYREAKSEIASTIEELRERMVDKGWTGEYHVMQKIMNAEGRLKASLFVQARLVDMLAHSRRGDETATVERVQLQVLEEACRLFDNASSSSEMSNVSARTNAGALRSMVDRFKWDWCLEEAFKCDWNFDAEIAKALPEVWQSEKSEAAQASA